MFSWIGKYLATRWIGTYLAAMSMTILADNRVNA